MSVHNGHRDRLRARFLKSGLEDFEEHVVLELLLFYARPRIDTNELAHRLIKRFGSFAAVLDAPMEELVKVEGVGETTATLLKMVPDMGAYYLASRSKPGEVISSTARAGEYFMPLFFGKTVEEVYMASLDDKQKVIRCVKLTDEGIVNAVRINVKRIVSEAVTSNATGVILAHNHPGGLALPSKDDKQVTQRIHEALRIISVRLVDHIVVADGDFVSMADSGYINYLNSDSER